MFCYWVFTLLYIIPCGFSLSNIRVKLLFKLLRNFFVQYSIPCSWMLKLSFLHFANFSFMCKQLILNISFTILLIYSIFCLVSIFLKFLLFIKIFKELWCWFGRIQNNNVSVTQCFR